MEMNAEKAMETGGRNYAEGYLAALKGPEVKSLLGVLASYTETHSAMEEIMGIRCTLCSAISEFNKSVGDGTTRQTNS